MKLAEQTFVITGTLERYKRDEAKQLIENAGGRVAESVSKNTNYLVAGSGTEGGSKLNKAQKIGVRVITEKQLEEMLQS